MTECAIISDPLRIPLVAQRLDDGRVMLRTPGRPPLFLSPQEVDRLSAFASNRATLQRYPAATNNGPVG